MELKVMLKELAKSNLIDYFGVAPVERLDNAPFGSRPQDLLPESQSIISLGIKLRSGVRAANIRAYQHNKMAIAIYMHFGHQFINDKLDHAAYIISRTLIDKGHRSVPLPAAHPYPFITEVVFDKTKEVNLFSNRHAAVAAGIGEFGWNSLLMTPDAGPRVRVVTVLTEAALEPDPMYAGQKLCRVDQCPNPLICAKVCPLKAIDLKEGVELKMGGKTFHYARINKAQCMWGICGLTKATLGKVDCYLPEEKTRESFYKAINEEDPLERQERFGNGHMCGQCIIHCPIGD